MKRTYLALAGAALASAALPAVLPSLGRASGVFESEPIDPSRFAVLARPLADGAWSLVILEQVQASTPCWQPRSDGLVEPLIQGAEAAASCGRYLDSNGYSLRVANEDLGGAFQLQLEQSGADLRLQASSPGQPGVLVVGSARVPAREQDALVPLQLSPGWELQRRMYGGQSLRHIYLSHPQPLEELQARGGGPALPAVPEAGLPTIAMAPPQPLPPIGDPPPASPTRPTLLAMGKGSSFSSIPRQRRRPGRSALDAALQGVSNGGTAKAQPIAPRGPVRPSAAVPTEPEELMVASGSAIPLPVIPFSE